MLCWRKVSRNLDLGRTFVHVWVDGPPQWRGTEMFAMSFAMAVVGEDGFTYTRRLFPCVSLRSRQMDATSKTISLLWAIFLLVGPSIDAVRSFCGRVRSIVSDNGCERSMAQMTDMIDDFVWFVHGATKAPCGLCNHCSHRSLDRQAGDMPLMY